MARIAVVVSNPCTTDARVIKMARAAAQAGHEVHVFATSGAEAPLYDVLDGVAYHRLDWRPGQILTSHLPLSLLQRVSRWLTMFIVKRITPYLKYHMFSGVFAEHIAALLPEIVHAHDLICLKAAHDAAQDCGAKLVYDAHELEIHRNPPLPFLQKRWVAHIEYKYASKAAAVNTVGRLVGMELAGTLGRNDINVLYNSPVIKPCHRKIRQDLRITDDAPLVIYVGKVTTGRGVGEIVALLPKLEGVYLATVGPCDDTTRRLLSRQAERLDVSSRFRILPPVPFEQVVDYIRGADLGIISVEPITLSYQYCMPNKLFELSFANIPIISNKLDEIEEYLAENDNGRIADFENKAALPYVIFRMLREKQRYVMDENRYQILWEKYSWSAQEEKLAAIYASILSSP